MKYSTRLCVNVGSPIYLKEEKEKKGGKKRKEIKVRKRGISKHIARSFRKVG